MKNFEPVWGLRNCRLTFTDTRPESATPSFDNLKPSELVVTESLHDDKPLGKKKKSTIDECDAPRKKFKRDEEILDTPITDIPDGKIRNSYFCTFNKILMFFLFVSFRCEVGGCRQKPN